MSDVKETLLKSLDHINEIEANTDGTCTHIIVSFLVTHGDDYTSTMSWSASATQFMWERIAMLREVARRMEVVSDNFRIPGDDD